MEVMSNCKEYPLLFAFEGCDGAGKTSLINSLVCSLSEMGFNAARYCFHNSKSRDSRLLEHFACNGHVSGELASALLCANFLATCDRAASSGHQILLFDRYKYTGMLKDHLHSIPKHLSESNYSVAPDPDMLFYIHISPEDAYERISSYREISFYETTELYTHGEVYKNHYFNFLSGSYTRDTLMHSFVSQKKREEAYWKNNVCNLSFCHELDGTSLSTKQHRLVLNMILQHCLGKQQVDLI